MSGKSWKRKYEGKHGSSWQRNNDYENIAITEGTYYSINSDSELIYEETHNIKGITGLDVIYPEGTKRVHFHSPCTLLGKVLDGEFILREDETERLMILWQDGLLFLATPMAISTGFRPAFYEADEAITFSEELVKRIQTLKNPMQNIEERLTTIGITFLLRADTIGFPDYNGLSRENRQKIKVANSPN